MRFALLAASAAAALAASASLRNSDRDAGFTSQGERVAQAVLAPASLSTEAGWVTPRFCGMDPDAAQATKIRRAVATALKGVLAKDDVNHDRQASIAALDSWVKNDPKPNAFQLSLKWLSAAALERQARQQEQPVSKKPAKGGKAQWELSQQRKAGGAVEERQEVVVMPDLTLTVEVAGHELHSTLCSGNPNWFTCNTFQDAQTLGAYLDHQNLKWPADVPAGQGGASAAKATVVGAFVTSIDSKSKLTAWYERGIKAALQQDLQEAGIKAAFKDVSQMGPWLAMTVHSGGNKLSELKALYKVPSMDHPTVADVAFKWAAEQLDFKVAVPMSGLVHVSVVKVINHNAADPAAIADLTLRLTNAIKKELFNDQPGKLLFGGVQCN